MVNGVDHIRADAVCKNVAHPVDCGFAGCPS